MAGISIFAVGRSGRRVLLHQLEKADGLWAEGIAPQLLGEDTSQINRGLRGTIACPNPLHAKTHSRPPTGQYTRCGREGNRSGPLST